MNTYLTSFNKAVKNLESGEWKSATTKSWMASGTNITIRIKKYKKRKVLQLVHRDGSTSPWQITSSNIFEDKYLEVS